MFNKYGNPGNASNAFSDDNFDGNGFPSDDNSGLLESSTDTNWQNMLNNYNTSNDPSSNSQVVHNDRYEPSGDFNDGFSDDFNDDLNDGFNDDFSDGFNDGFNDGFSDGFNDGFNDGFSDGFNDGFNDDFSDGINHESADNDSFTFDSQSTGNASRSHSQSQDLVSRLIMIMVFVAFAIGVLFVIKYRNFPKDLSHDNDNAGVQSNPSQQADPEIVSSEPASVSSDEAGTTATTETASSTETTEATKYKAIPFKETSDDVKKMQTRLYELGYIDIGSCTGYFGSYTQKVLKRFQKAAGLKQTGEADVETLTRLYADDAPAYKR